MGKFFYSVLLIVVIIGSWEFIKILNRDYFSADPKTPVLREILNRDEIQTIRIFNENKNSVVYISTIQSVMDVLTHNVYNIPSGTGSGFVWDEAGHIITNYHVIKNASGAIIRLNDGRDYPASLIGSAPEFDLAVLKINVPVKPPRAIVIGTSNDLKVGQSVYAIGNPFGLDWTLTTGVVSALDRTIGEKREGMIEHLIQTDAAINPGNSGGPLLDSSGHLIGVNTAIFSPSGAYAGVGFAIPVDLVNRVVPKIIASSH